MVDRHIKLIVTGDSEKKSLHESLQRCFPSHTVNGDPVIWDTPRKVDGATSYRLKGGVEPSASMKGLVDAMFAEVLEGKKPNGSPPDFVIVVDDVELGNVGQEGIVVQSFLEAVNAKLARLIGQHSAAHFKKIQTRIQTCCSFHLLCPMVEAYFFADPNTLTHGGVAVATNSMLAHPTDVEQFDASSDPHPDWKAICNVKNAEQILRAPWWKTELHPKHYLTHLLSVSKAPAYHETTLGASMIKVTDWSTVAKTSTDSPIISALLEDIWEWYGLQPPAGHCVGISSPTMHRLKTTPPLQRILRNL
jgi:hypothetical protein